MADCQELLEHARTEPSGLRFSELCHLAECFGFTHARQKGSHVMYKRPGYFGLMNFQDDGGNAKPYQVRQLLRAIKELGLVNNDEGNDADS